MYQPPTDTYKSWEVGWWWKSSTPIISKNSCGKDCIFFSTQFNVYGKGKEMHWICSQRIMNKSRVWIGNKKKEKRKKKWKMKVCSSTWQLLEFPVNLGGRQWVLLQRFTTRHDFVPSQIGQLFVTSICKQQSGRKRKRKAIIFITKSWLF